MRVVGGVGGDGGVGGEGGLGDGVVAHEGGVAVLRAVRHENNKKQG
jgi:hypothetical protein